MVEPIQIGVLPCRLAIASTSKPSRTVLWLQGITLAWMLVEAAVAAYAAIAGHSPAMAAFGSDSLVELLSASVVLLQWIPGLSISKSNATRVAASLLFLLALVVVTVACLSLALRLRPDTNRAGIGITLAALLAMPVLAFLKRREARRINNPALAADAVQSATCACIALISLAGLALNAGFHMPWFDPLAALAIVPILLKEARSTWQGHSCGCC